ncbi:integration host factor subunit beta [Fodinibius salinus]|uniref:Integration host factor subunit beta n=1 Tax=Fodinibius salinus TaxID=860790 RepID=A0A5D3YG73_9BACT|nr:HU family DNA-binding protein [Fodinibius salinus]TYP92003.1 integration host factor subunit beta [Fodinibius salinus]
MITYTKRDIVRRVAEKMDEPKVHTEPWVDSVLNALRETMMDADPECRIELRNFGVFEVKKTKAKPRARNPRTNEEIYVPPHRKTHFKPSKLLKQFLKQPLEEEEKEESEG